MLLFFSANVFAGPSSVVAQYVEENTQDALDAAQREAEISFNYSPGSLYRIYAKEGYLTAIRLQQGENILYIGGGDTVRWVIDKAPVGSGASRTWVVYLKPMKTNLTTNFVINTDRHNYQIEAKASTFYNPMISWNYPQEERAAFLRAQEVAQKKETESIQLGVYNYDRLNFDYAIEGKSLSWTPKSVFDDGQKVYIKMPVEISRSEAPALFIGEKKALAIVNYRVKNGFYIVDRLFDTAELRVGKETVKIRKTSERGSLNGAA